MTGVSHYLSILILNINRLIPQLKDTDWLNGFLKRVDNMLATRNSHIE
jgi:hypothetical protein